MTTDEEYVWQLVLTWQNMTHGYASPFNKIRRTDKYIRILLVIIAALLVCVVHSHTARSQIFGGGVTICTTILGEPCASEPSQLEQYALQGLQYIRQALQLEQEVITAEQEVLNTLKLPASLYQSGEAVIAAIVQMAEVAQLGLGNPQIFIKNLAAPVYPDIGDPYAEIIRQQNAVSNGINTLGNVIGTINPPLTQRAAILDSIQAQSLGALGRLQALQNANQVAATTGQDIHSLVNLQLTEAEAHHAVMLAEHDRQAMEDLTMKNFSDHPLGQPNGFNVNAYQGF